jgi:uncharacterized membrane protein YecN with MAPEG domain
MVTFYEFTVFFIISSFLLEILDANQIYVLLVNTIFLLGRISHAYSMLKEKLLFRIDWNDDNSYVAT